MELIKDFEIRIEDIPERKPKPAEDTLKFGQVFTDRMAICHWKNGTWQIPEIVPYSNFDLSPASLVFHYGQAIFEGMKAYKHPDGSVHLFRPYENARRFNLSAKRMMMPTMEEELFVQIIRTLVKLESDWVPSILGSSLYIRPTMIASEAVLGVRSANEFLFFVILSPSGYYFENGFQPTSIKVETEYIRAADGGTGAAKAAGNYAGSLLASKKAKEQGYSQVLWLDAKERRYVEEVGAMNIAFVIDDVICSTAPAGTILDGITRRSVLHLASELNMQVNEKRISIDFIIESIRDGQLTEMFGIGTAAVIAPVGKILYKDQEYCINSEKVGPITRQLYTALTDIQYGKSSDVFNWMIEI